MNSHAELLLKSIRGGKTHVGIIGLGYVGLPLALAFAEKDFKVTGFDIDEEKIRLLRDGKNYIKHMDAAKVANTLKTKPITATTDFGKLGEPDALIIAVPTPLTPQREPDMTYVVKTTEAVAKHLRKGQLVVLESTTYPGTTDELVKDILEAKTGLKMGQDFFLAFSPEREDPGNPNFHTATIPKVVGGVDAVSGDLAQTLYDKVIAKTVRVSSARAAEAAKLTENIFRAVNIALVNELKIVYDKMGINVWEVLDAAATKPFGFMRFNPGPGWGGHCIPLDPFYLSWKAREYGVSPKFIELAGEVNVAMPLYVVNKLQEALNEAGKAMKGAKILLMGMAYKKDIDDTRESPSLEVMHLLDKLGSKYDYHDPHVPVLQLTRHSPEKAGFKSVELSAANVGSYDAVLIVTDHTKVDYAGLAKNAKLIVDSRGVYQKPEYAGVEGLAKKLVMA
jgi:UDP-N-acetyl-D-glucosamine dehydrogenase